MPDICQDQVPIIDQIEADCIAIPFLHFLLGVIPKILKELKIKLMREDSLKIVESNPMTEEEQQEINELNTKLNNMKLIHEEWLTFFDKEMIEEEIEGSIFLINNCFSIPKTRSAV